VTHSTLMKRISWIPLLLALAAACSGGGSSGAGEAATGSVLVYPFTGTKKVLIVVVKLRDAQALFPETIAGEDEVRAIRDAVVDALERDSYGELTLDIDYTWPPLLIDKAVGDYGPSDSLMRVRADALAVARHAGYDVDAYERAVIFSPRVWNGDGLAWVNTIWMPNTLRWVLVHEIGHTLGRGHADFWDGDPSGATGRRISYGDIFDPMGTGKVWNRFLHANPWFKLRAGWLPAQDVLTVERSGTYTLAPLEHPDPAIGPVALRIREDALHDYWIFHRAGEPLVGDGAVLLRVPTNPYSSSLLLDMNRGSTGPEVEDARLARGQTYDDAARTGIVVENVSAVDGAVTLEITVDEDRQRDMDRVPVIGVLEPARDEGPVSGVVDFEVTAYDPDAGTSNGAGIAKVTLTLVPAPADNPPIVARVEVTAPPYRLTHDTADGSMADAFHDLVARVEGVDGGVNLIQYHFMVDNAGAAAPAGPSVSSSPRSERVDAHRPATVYGSVVDPAGRPVAGVGIRVSDREWLPRSACGATPPGSTWTAQTNAGGDYVLDGLPADRALFWFLTGPDGARAHERASVLEAGGQRRDWALAPPPRVVGRLRDDRGIPLAGREITLRNGPVVSRATTDGEGAFSFERVAHDGREGASPWARVTLALPDEPDALLTGDVVLDVPPGARTVTAELVARPATR